MCSILWKTQNQHANGDQTKWLKMFQTLHKIQMECSKKTSEQNMLEGTCSFHQSLQMDAKRNIIQRDSKTPTCESIEFI